MKVVKVSSRLLFFDPGTQFPMKKNYAMQRQNTIFIEHPNSSKLESEALV